MYVCILGFGLRTAALISRIHAKHLCQFHDRVARIRLTACLGIYRYWQRISQWSHPLITNCFEKCYRAVGRTQQTVVSIQSNLRMRSLTVSITICIRCRRWNQYSRQHIGLFVGVLVEERAAIKPRTSIKRASLFWFFTTTQQGLSTAADITPAPYLTFFIFVYLYNLPIRWK